MNFPLEYPIPKIKKFKSYKLSSSLARTGSQLTESHGSRLLQLDDNDQVIYRESPPSISEKFDIILMKVIKIKRIKYRTDDRIDEY